MFLNLFWIKRFLFNCMLYILKDLKIIVFFKKFYVFNFYKFRLVFLLRINFVIRGWKNFVRRGNSIDNSSGSLCKMVSMRC